jgi:hypothetical protein
MTAVFVSAIAGLAANGDGDPTFGTGGTTVNASVLGFYGGVRLPDDRVLFVGETTTGDFAVEMLQANGMPDPSFGTGGFVTTDFSGGEDYAVSAALVPDGGFVVGGGAQNATATTTSPSPVHGHGRPGVRFWVRREGPDRLRRP